MGYGDGFAAIIGQKYGKHSFKKYGFDKSLEGSLTVLFFGLLISGIFFAMYSPSNLLIKTLVIGLSATVIELLSPNGFDNLSLPLFISFIAMVLKITL
jgi:dolichol kinase